MQLCLHHICVRVYRNCTSKICLVSLLPNHCCFLCHTSANRRFHWLNCLQQLGALKLKLKLKLVELSEDICLTQTARHAASKKKCQNIIGNLSTKRDTQHRGMVQALRRDLRQRKEIVPLCHWSIWSIAWVTKYMVKPIYPVSLKILCCLASL